MVDGVKQINDYKQMGGQLVNGWIDGRAKAPVNVSTPCLVSQGCDILKRI